jgi:hypothetical protein
LPPTQISGSPWQSAWNSSTTPKLAPTASTFAVSVGDVIVAGAVSENGQTFGAPTNAAGTSPATITWTARPNIGTAGSTTRAAMWTGVVTVAGNVQVSIARTSVSGGATDLFGIIVWAFNSHGGVGTTASGSGAASLPSATPVVAWTANSTVCCINGDWTAVSHGATRSYRTNIGAATERNYAPTDSNYTTEAWEHADSGAAPGSGAIGLTTPNMTWSLVGVEVLAPGGAAPAADPVASTPILFPLRIFQSFGPPLIAGFEGTDDGGPTLLTDTDTGTGSETSDVQATVPGSDTSTGTDTGTVSATVPSSDSATGTDTQTTLSATVPGSDTATGTETSTGSITAPGSDSGTGTEAATTAVTLSDSDSGTGTDAQVSIVSPVAGSDTASGTEAGTVSAAVPGSESSTGTESSSASVTAAGTDSATGSDAGSAAASVPASDSATGTEGSVVTETGPGGEGGAGSDSGTVSATVPGSDSGSGTDAGSVADITGGATPVSGSDSGTGSESGVVVDLTPPVDTGPTGGADYGDESAIHGEPTRHLTGSDRAGSMELGFVVDLTPKSVRPPLRIRLPQRRERPRVLDATDEARVVEDSVLFVGVETRSDMGRGSESAQLVDITPEDPDEMAMVMALLFD